MWANWGVVSWPSAAELCPENGGPAAPVSVSGLAPHSSPRGHGCPANLPPTTDVLIHRKESEGFGFVIISSLNRPENSATISECCRASLSCPACYETYCILSHCILFTCIPFSVCDYLRALRQYVLWWVTPTPHDVMLSRIASGFYPNVVQIPPRVLPVCLLHVWFLATALESVQL